MMDNTRTATELIKDHERWEAEQEKIINEFHQKNREDALKVPFDEDLYQLKARPQDMAELYVLQAAQQEIDDFIKNHDYEIDTSRTKADLLHSYLEASGKHEMSMDHVI